MPTSERQARSRSQQVHLKGRSDNVQTYCIIKNTSADHPRCASTLHFLFLSPCKAASGARLAHAPFAIF
eukprot:scaffold13404_cov118-Isochrysis_galbana.AAC.2